jgi:tetratricopeptide (TPR) repeat protein
MVRARKRELPDPGKREFLVRSCRGVAGVIGWPLLLSGVPDPHSGEFHLHPQYRTATTLDPVLLKVDAGLDRFVSEKYADKIAAVLVDLSGELLRSPRDLRGFGEVLAVDFWGSSMRPVDTRVLRSGVVSTSRLSFASTRSLGREAFLADLRFAWDGFTRFRTAEFQVTQIEVGNADVLQTRVRYELVGEGSGFHREQRVGEWAIDWDLSFHIRGWSADNEVRSRSAAPVYVDISGQAFAGAPSYFAQLAQGVDYWRTVLDGACGIDIYGHNGVSVGDIDGDGFDDLYVCQPAGLPNRLYRNRGDGTFEDITDNSGVGLLDNTACALFADFDNDGRQDLVVVRAAGPLLFLNQGGGKFRAAPKAFQFSNPPQGTFTGAAAADYDRDGWLDIYFCLYTYYQGTDLYKYPAPYYNAENGPPNFLMRNNRDGTFRDVTGESGMKQNNTRFSFCCAWGDANGDGWPDLYVANDFGRKNLYRNNRDGTFTDVASQSGVEDIGAGMSVCWFASQDLYVADMWTAAGERIASQPEFQRDASPQIREFYRKHAMGNSLFRNRGDGTFRNASATSGTAIGRWSWSSDTWDFDHDGFSDLYVVNGMISGPLRPDLNSFFWRQVVANSPDGARSSYEYEQGWNAINELIRADHTWSGYERNVFYASNRDGTYSDVSGVVDLDFLEDGRAFALADFDHDGRQELFLKNRSGPQLRLLKNVASELPPSIAFRLRGVKSNRDAIGAAVTIETERGPQTRMVQAGSGFLSQHSKEIFFGLGEGKGLVDATIRWPSGLVQKIDKLPPGHLVYVEEGAAPTKMIAFGERAGVSAITYEQHAPATLETWLLAPVSAPDFVVSATGKLLEHRGKPVLLSFCGGHWRPDSGSIPVVTIAVDRPEFQDTTSVYNLLYRYLFDRHRDLEVPTSFLIDEKGDIVKVYQDKVSAATVERDCRIIPRTAAERLGRALPFRGVADTYDFGRNYLSLASIFFQRGYAEQAESFFHVAVRDDPESAEAVYGLGSVYLKQERLPDARASFEKAVKLKPGYPDTLPNAWNNLGLLATREGNIDTAIDCFREALRVSPDHFVALQNLGNAYRQSKQWDEALQTLQRAVAIRPQDPEANYSLGMVFAQTDDTQQAFEYLQRALKRNPAYPEALNNLGILYLKTRRRDQAVAAFEECIRVAPKFDQSYLNLARVYSIEGEPDKARSVLRDLLKQHPDHAAARAALEQLR